jgi:Tol biopolymer transport system component
MLRGPASTTRVSVTNAGQQSNGASSNSSLTDDGRYVAFESVSTNLPSQNDTNGVQDIFVRDRTAGTTVRASVSSSNKQANDISRSSAMAKLGRYVVFESVATNLVSGDRNRKTDVFLRDLTAGTTTGLSVSSSGVEGTGDSRIPTITPDGRYVAFYSSASNLVTGDTNGKADIFVRDRVAGTTVRASVGPGGVQGDQDVSFSRPSISADGRYVAFVSPATNLVTGDSNGLNDVFVRDLVDSTTVRVSVSSFADEANSSSASPAISADGAFVAFASAASNLAPNDFGKKSDIFVHELASSRTWRVSVATSGAEPNDSSSGPSISADGRYIAFTSLATNLKTPDNNVGDPIFDAAGYDVFVHDRTNATTTIASVSTSGSQSLGLHTTPDISGDGRYVSFDSTASLGTGDTNGVEDVFLRDRGASVVPLVVLDTPSNDDEVFGSQSLAATVLSGFTAARVDFLVDGGLVASDSSAPYQATWDTTTVTDGTHSITATAVAAGGATTTSEAAEVTVINAAACDSKVHADFLDGRIGVDDYVKSGIYCLFERRLLGARYDSTAVAANNQHSYYRFLSQWENASQGARDEIDTFFADLDAGKFYTRLDGAPFGSSRASAIESAEAVSAQSVECITLQGRFGIIAKICTYTTPEFEFVYSTEEYNGGVPDVDSDGDQVPNAVETMEASFRDALVRYRNMGYVDPFDTGSRLRIHLYRYIGQATPGYAPPPGAPGDGIYIDANETGYLPRHELSHAIQWQYADSSLDYFSRFGTALWAEATAEWAADKSSPPGDLEPQRYARALPDFLGEPFTHLNHADWNDDDSREYGAFLLAKYLEQKYDADIIRRSWVRVGPGGDGLGALEALDEVLKTQYDVTNGLSAEINDFWERNYLLKATPDGYTDPDLTFWRTILNDDPRTTGDGAEGPESAARPFHTQMRLVGGREVTQQTLVERGGAFYVDLVHDLRRPALINIRVANRELFGQLTNGAVNVKLLSFERDNFPNLCPTGTTNITLVSGVASQPVELDESCEFSTLMITNVAPINGEPMVQDISVKYDAGVSPGDVFVSSNTGRVLVYRQDGAPVTAWDTGQAGEITGSVFDDAGNFYVTAFDASRVKKFAPDGTLLGDFGSGYSTSPESIAVDGAGTFYVGHALGTKDIHKRDGQGNLIQAFDVAFEDIRGSDWIALRPDGCTMLYTSEGTRLFQYDVCTGAQLPDLATLGSTSFQIRILPDGGLLVASLSVIRRLSPEGALLQTYDASGQNCWFAIDATADASAFWAGDTCSGFVYKFDTQTGQVLLSLDTGGRRSPGTDALGGITIKPTGSGVLAPEAPAVIQPSVSGDIQGESPRSDGESPLAEHEGG